MSNDLIPPSVTDLPSLQEVSEAFASATAEVRKLEALRKAKTDPQRVIIQDYIDAEKYMKAPHVAVLEATEKALSDWRLLPDVQEALSRRRHLERTAREDMKAGNETGLAFCASAIAEIDEKYPKTVKTSIGSLIFGERLEIRIEDESLIPEMFFKKVVDEDAIKEFIKTTAADVAGVAHGWKYNVSLRQDKS